MAYGVNAPFGLRPFCSINGGSWTEKVNEYYISTAYASSIYTGDPVIFNTSNTSPNSVPGAGYLGTAGTIAIYLPVYADGTPSTFSITPILGVFMGCEYTLPTGVLVKSPFWPGGTTTLAGSTIKCWVVDDPTVVYDIQLSTHVDANANNFNGLAPVLPIYNPAGNNAGATLAGSFGANFALNIGGSGSFNTINDSNGNNLGYANNPATGSNYTGQSAYYLDVTTTTGGVLTHDYNKTLVTLPLKAIGYTRNPNNIPRANPTSITAPTMANTPFLNVMVMINNHAYKAGTLGATLANAQP